MPPDKLVGLMDGGLRGRFPTIASLVRRAWRAICGLASCRTSAPLSFSDATPPPLFGRDDKFADDVKTSLERRMRLTALADPEAPPSGRCLSALLGSENTTCLSPTLTVRPYDASLVNIVSSDHAVVPLEGLLDADSLHVAQHPELYILRAPGDVSLDFEGFVPYSDPLLLRPQALLGLASSLLSK